VPEQLQQTSDEPAAGAEPAPSDELTLKPADASEPPAEEKTMVLPPAQPGQDGDQTVVFEGANAAAAAAGAAPDEPKDFGMLSTRTAPDNVKPEQVRSLAFIYAVGEEDFCADVLCELDAICLKSSASPMFINRPLVEVCGDGVNGNVVLQKVSDAKSLGLVCLGNVPQETVYEVENVFTAAGVFFRHYTRETFGHSAALDLVMELILK